jgi:hypothetical protein
LNTGPAGHQESAQLRGYALWNRKHAVVIIAIDREVAFTVENDVVVDFDFRLGHNRGGAVTPEEVRTASSSDRVADTLLGARESSRATVLTAAYGRKHGERKEGRKSE